MKQTKKGAKPGKVLRKVVPLGRALGQSENHNETFTRLP